MIVIQTLLGIYYAVFIWPVEVLIGKRFPRLFACWVLTVGFPVAAYAVYLWIRAWRDG